MKLTEKEKEAIEALQKLADTWPKTLLLGREVGPSEYVCIWKREFTHVHISVQAEENRTG